MPNSKPGNRSLKDQFPMISRKNPPSRKRPLPKRYTLTDKPCSMRRAQLPLLHLIRSPNDLSNDRNREGARSQPISRKNKRLPRSRRRRRRPGDSNSRDGTRRRNRKLTSGKDFAEQWERRELVARMGRESWEGRVMCCLKGFDAWSANERVERHVCRTSKILLRRILSAMLYIKGSSLMISISMDTPGEEIRA